MRGKPGNTKGGSIIVPLTSCLTGLDQPVLQIKTKIVSCNIANSKPVKQEVNGILIRPPLVFPGQTYMQTSCASGLNRSGSLSIVERSECLMFVGKDQSLPKWSNFEFLPCIESSLHVYLVNLLTKRHLTKVQLTKWHVEEAKFWHRDSKKSYFFQISMSQFC